MPFQYDPTPQLPIQPAPIEIPNTAISYKVALVANTINVGGVLSYNTNVTSYEVVYLTTVAAAGGGATDTYARSAVNNACEFVYTDVAANGMYTSWASLYAAYQAAGSPPARIGFIQFAPAPSTYLYIPSGTYAFAQGTEWVGLANGAEFYPYVTANTGAVVSGVVTYRALSLLSNSTGPTHTLDTVDYSVTLWTCQVSTPVAGKEPWFKATNSADENFINVREGSLLHANSVNVADNTYLGLYLYDDVFVYANAVVGLSATTTLEIYRADTAAGCKKQGPGGLFAGTIDTGYLYEKYGLTANRPLHPANGAYYYDTTLGYPLWRHLGAWTGLPAASITTGIISVARGGTGKDATGIANGQLLIGNTVNSGFDLATIAQSAPVIVTVDKGAITISHARSGVTAATLGGSNRVIGYTVDANGHITGTSNVAIDLLDAAAITTGTLLVARGGTGQASYTNGQILIGNTGSTGLDKATIAQSAPIIITNLQGSITVSHARTTVVPATYGSQALVPVFTVDANGHLTVVTDTAIGGLATTVLTTGILSVARGGTGKDATSIANGQLLIANTVNSGFDLATVTAGNGILVTNDKGSITVAAAGGGATDTYARWGVNSACEFIYTDVAANGMYTSWASLYAAYQAAGSPPARIGFIQFAPAPSTYLYIPSGTYAFAQGTEWVGLARTVDSYPFVTANTGAVVSGVVTYRALSLLSNSTGPTHTLDDVDYSVTLDLCEVACVAGKEPWFKATNSADQNFINVREGSLLRANSVNVADNTYLGLYLYDDPYIYANAVVSLDATATLEIYRADTVAGCKKQGPGGLFAGTIDTGYLYEKYGDTANRPLHPADGAYYYDTDLGVPVWRASGAWQDVISIRPTFQQVMSYIALGA